MIDNKRIVFVITGIIFCLFFYIVIFSNDSLYDEPVKNSVTFSKESGFYEDEFELILSAPDEYKIFYTLDGSVPNENSLLYEKGIIIDNASSHANYYSMREDLSTGFYEGLVKEYSDFPNQHYIVPDYNIDKCTIVRAVAMDQWGNISDVETNVYFVGFEDKEIYDYYMIISLVTDPNNLFDSSYGIYVTGDTFDRYICSDEWQKHETWESNTWPAWDANYRNRGADWEREAYIQIYSTDRQSLLSEDCSIRIHGNLTRGYYPKSLNIYAKKDEYDIEEFSFNPLSDTEPIDSFTLFAGGNDNLILLRDIFYHTAMRGRDVSLMDFEPCVLFLDGEFWGFYYLTSKYDEMYFSEKYNVPSEQVVMIKNNVVELGNEDDIILYNEFVSFIEKNDFSDQEMYDKVCQMMDMQSFIDYFASYSYISRTADWPSLNWALWRTRDGVDNKFGDSKWRWICFDLNSDCLTNDLIELDNVSSLIKDDMIFSKLCESPEFRKQFTLTAMDIANTCFDEGRANEYLYNYENSMLDILKHNARRFRGSDMETDILETIESTRLFLNCREDYFVSSLSRAFDLDANLVTVNINHNACGGQIKLNTINISEDMWSGNYFRDYPITLEAIPYEGYEFVEWEGDISSSDELVNIVFDSYNHELTINATFRECEE